MQVQKEEISAPIKGRVHIYLQNNNIPVIDFCKRVGISPSAFKGKDRKSEFGGAVISRIVEEFPTIPIRWLITGEADDSTSIHIAGGANAVAQGGGVITYHNNPVEVGGESLQDSTSVIAILKRIIDTQNEQLAKKDEQIDKLLKVISG